MVLAGSGPNAIKLFDDLSRAAPGSTGRTAYQTEHQTDPRISPIVEIGLIPHSTNPPLPLASPTHRRRCRLLRLPAV
jgi:hypothetical protein